MDKYTKYAIKDFLYRAGSFVVVIVSAIICAGSFIIAMIDGIAFSICTIPGVINIGGAIIFEKWDFFWGIMKFFGIMGLIFVVFALICGLFRIICIDFFGRFENGC